ncbi:MAG: hypothetical protein AAGH40_13175 [Verrucomicrobiota bacterium]
MIVIPEELIECEYILRDNGEHELADLVHERTHKIFTEIENKKCQEKKLKRTSVERLIALNFSGGGVDVLQHRKRKKLAADRYKSIVTLF